MVANMFNPLNAAGALNLPVPTGRLLRGVGGALAACITTSITTIITITGITGNGRAAVRD